MNKLVYVVAFASLFVLTAAWEQEDLELYDLYEELNGTFYELLGVSNDASVTEIRRSYRKLSLTLHPDKNEAENAEEQFRQLVAVYEILKDKDKRQKYDDVLQNGLPDWRQPIYYYRKYRKMGTLEISILISIIFTVGHYLTWWVAYLEKKFEMDEVLDPLRKRLEKNKKKGKAAEEDEIDTDAMLEQELGYRRPGKWDILPFVLYRCFIRLIKFTVNTTKDTYRQYYEKKEKDKIALEEEEAFKAEEIKPRPKRVKPQIALRDASEFDKEGNGYVPGMPRNDTTDSDDTEKQQKKSEWTDEDYAALAKSMAKFPGGTPGRWERIAHELGRSPSEVIKKVKDLKSSLTSNVATSGGNNLTKNKKRDTDISEFIITKAIDVELKNTFIITDSQDYQSQEEIPEDYDEGSAPPDEPEIDYTANIKTKKKTRPVEENPVNPENKDQCTESQPTPPEADVWSQVQQKCLEAAIKQFPKSTSDRWTCISRAVPNKNKEQCIARFKWVAEQVKKQRMTKDT